jgi:NADPH-dependent 2,4-dienoyl-CoA reductase/sulfur reductase-like enzyme
MVVIGGGAAGYAAAEMLRREGYGGGVTIVTDDAAAPYDRPNLSKDYLAGTAPEEWIPLRPPEFYAENGIDLRLGATATTIDVAGPRHARRRRSARLRQAAARHRRRTHPPAGAGGRFAARAHAALARRQPRSDRPCRQGSRAVIIGASFIGLEVAAALRHRGLEVHVVAPEARPMERILGPTLGDFVRQLHGSHGVVFHLGQVAAAIEAGRVRLDHGASIGADFVVVGIGVRPRIELAQQAGLAIDRGVLVDEYLETGAPGIFAAGDIARWPDAYSGERLRIEHWVVAERQGQTAAHNMLGGRERYAAVPFFWSQHYDVSIDYVGHAAAWDAIVEDGDPNTHDVALRFRQAGRTLAVATIFRGRESLVAELAMERGQSP